MCCGDVLRQVFAGSHNLEGLKTLISFLSLLVEIEFGTEKEKERERERQRERWLS